MEEIKIPMAKPVLEDEEMNGIMNVVKSGWLGQGEVTAKFENSNEADKESSVIATAKALSFFACLSMSSGSIDPDNNEYELRTRR